MKKKIDKLTIEGVDYIPAAQVPQLAASKDGLPYVMIRTYSAGVHCGYLKSREGKEVTLLDSIRIWRWAGAASLSQLSQEGTNNPDECKFGVPIIEITLTEAIEIIPMTETAKQSIQNVESWKA
jgi:hypothetical protein